MANSVKIEPKVLHELLRYDPTTGKLFWRKRPAKFFKNGRNTAQHRCNVWNSRRAGKEALFSLNRTGYLQGSILNRKYFAHRVVWAMETGEWPVDQIDHINGDPSDNRIANLRDVSASENGRNKRIAATNTSGVIGVNWNVINKKWRAQINVKGRQIHLGVFHRFDAAVDARKAAEARFGYHKNHGRTA